MYVDDQGHHSLDHRGEYKRVCLALVLPMLRQCLTEVNLNRQPLAACLFFAVTRSLELHHVARFPTVAHRKLDDNVCVKLCPYEIMNHFEMVQPPAAVKGK